MQGLIECKSLHSHVFLMNATVTTSAELKVMYGARCESDASARDANSEVASTARSYPITNICMTQNYP